MVTLVTFILTIIVTIIVTIVIVIILSRDWFSHTNRRQQSQNIIILMAISTSEIIPVWMLVGDAHL